MSGILAITHLDASPLDADLGVQLAANLAFRATGAPTFWHDERVGLGHAAHKWQCALPDAQYPLTFDERVFLVAHARIDDQANLVTKLRQAGRDVPTGCSDDALILHAYHAWGMAFMEHLIGNFAFILYDADAQRLLAVRDHFGVYPLFIVQKAGYLLIGNTLRTLREHPIVSDALDDLAVMDFITIGHPQDFERTVYADIRRLPPGHMLHVDLQANTAKIEAYWQPPTLNWQDIAVQEATETFLQIFKQVVNDHFRTPNALVSISGGLDASSVTAVAQALHHEGEIHTAIRAFTVGAYYLSQDPEPYYAHLVTEHIKVPLSDYQIEERIPVLTGDDLHAVFRAMDEPFGNIQPPASIAIQNWLQADESFVTGLGGDPLLDGAPHYHHAIRQQGLWSRIPRDALTAYRHFGIRRHVLLAPRSQIDETAIQKRWQMLESVLNPDMVRRYDVHERFKLQMQHLQDTPELAGMTRKPFWSYILASGDGGNVGKPIHALHPFFDVRLYRFVQTLPTYPYLFQKQILRDAMQGLLPDVIRKRPKTGVRGNARDEILRRYPVAWRRKLLPYLDAAAPYLNVSTCRALLEDDQQKIPAFSGFLYWLRHRSGI